MDTSGALVMVIDPEGKIIKVNRTFEKILGLKFEQIWNTVIWDAKSWEPDTAPLLPTLAEFKTGGYAVAFEQDGFFVLKRDNESI